MNEIQAIRQNSRRRALDQLRKIIPRINQLYYDLPYCDECKERVLRRAPCKHLKATNRGLDNRS